ncbi:phosphate ABC transporter substrate-binding protein PstS [Streptomyces sp. NBC_01262]|uniref:phosphate ABC transporter substrate-binding protein PstS n=1 Tax=Streptomyces sp. NBC_01262 TaxID=2903803 RepID=UPI002E359CEA|nr:phosphate ABC transporter substrate-binding protein PstS [Streptomyces sp. NBC_01262]
MAGGVLLAACEQGVSGGNSSSPAVARPLTATRTSIDCATHGQLLGSGSTAQEIPMTLWRKNYTWACPGVEIAYRPVGSVAGLAQFLREANAFGGSDSPLKPEDVARSRQICESGHGIDLPMLGGPIAIGYNLPGVDGLVLDAPTLARIFDAKITRWNDPAIRKLNPQTSLPSTAITTFHRQDSSGTTQNLNRYLAAAAPGDWPYPDETTWQGNGSQSAQGPDGIAAQVKAISGAIGYFGLPVAVADGIKTVSIATGASRPVPATPQTAAKGIAAATVAGTGKDLALKLGYGTKAEGAYPIVLVTYEIVCDRGNAPGTLPLLKSFLAYTASKGGQRLLADAHYAPLPPAIAAKVRRIIPTLS